MLKKQGEMNVISNIKIAKDVFELTLTGDVATHVQQPGQFVNIKVTKSDVPFLRRPISVAAFTKTQLILIYKVVGTGTKHLSHLKIGDNIDILSGLGHGYTDLDADKPLLIGGGVGIPPLYGLAKAFVEKGIRPTILLGFKCVEEAFYLDEFKLLGDVVVMSEDGSIGEKGLVTDKLSALHFDKYYSCGPIPMLQAIHQLTHVSGYVSLEARMACGFGACMGCVCKNNKTEYARICVEGPVFNASEVFTDES